MKEETPMKTNCTAKQLEFQGLCGKKIILSNDGDLTRWRAYPDSAHRKAVWDHQKARYLFSRSPPAESHQAQAF
jgi:hypothetical protein